MTTLSNNGDALAAMPTVEQMLCELFESATARANEKRADHEKIIFTRKPSGGLQLHCDAAPRPFQVYYTTGAGTIIRSGRRGLDAGENSLYATWPVAVASWNAPGAPAIGIVHDTPTEAETLTVEAFVEREMAAYLRR